MSADAFVCRNSFAPQPSFLRFMVALRGALVSSLVANTAHERINSVATQDNLSEYLIAPDLSRRGLSRAVDGIDQDGKKSVLSVVEERPLTIFLNAQEIVTAMTIGDYPEYLALGFLRNQGMLPDDADVTGISYDEELETVVVRTATQTSFEDKLKKKTRTSGCAVGCSASQGLWPSILLNVPPIKANFASLYHSPMSAKLSARYT